MKALVVGLGSMGRRRLDGLRALGVEAEALSRSGAGAFATREEAEAWGPDAVIVCSPTSLHLDDARWALEGGRHVLVEKPLATSPDGVGDLIALADGSRLCLAVAYNLRFHPALETIRGAVAGDEIGALLTARLEVGQYLPDWHPDDDYRASYAPRAELGGGALLTLSHELDLALWIAGPARAVSGLARRVSKLELDVDDVAEVLVEHDSGAVSSVHMDLLDRAYNRSSRWVGENGTLAWAWGGPVRLLREGREEILWDDPSFTVAGTYERELADFLAAVADGRAPRADGRAGLAVLEACAAVTVRP